MTAVAQMPSSSDRRVRVWFGGHVIADYTAEPVKAIQYQAAMTRRFYGLRVTIEPATSAVGEDVVNV
jgi:hypothetical protein